MTLSLLEKEIVSLRGGGGGGGKDLYLSPAKITLKDSHGVKKEPRTPDNVGPTALSLPVSLTQAMNQHGVT